MSNTENDDLRPEYTLEDFPGGFVRGKYAGRLGLASNVVRIRPDIFKIFPDEESVNDALQSLIDSGQVTKRQAK